MSMKSMLTVAEHLCNYCKYVFQQEKEKTNIYHQNFLALSFNGRRNFHVQQVQIFTKLLITLCYREKGKKIETENICVWTALQDCPTAHHPANREVELPTLSAHIHRYHV